MTTHFRSQKRTVRILAGLLIGTCLVGGLALAMLQVRSVAKNKIARTLEALEVRDDIPVRVESWRLGLVSARLENISVGKHRDLLINEVVADVDWNPFSSTFGRLESVEVDRIQLRLGSDDLLGQLAKLKNHQPPAAMKPEEIESGDLFSRLPVGKTVNLRSAGMKIVDSFGRTQYRLLGMSLLADLAQKRIVFRVGRVDTPTGQRESGIEGRFSLADDSSGYDFWFGKNMRKSRPWYLKGHLSKARDAFEVQIDTRTLPEFLLPMVRRFIAKPQGIQAITKISAQKEPGGWKFNANGRMTGIRLAHRTLSAQVVGPFGVGFGARGIWLPREDLINIKQGHMAIFDRRSKNPTKLTFSGGTRISRQDQSTTELFGVLKLPETPCNALVASPPQNFAPRLEAFQLRGNMRFAMEFNVPLDRPEDFYYQFLESEFSCEVEEAPYPFTAKHLKGAFYLTREHDNRQIRVSLDPQSDRYSPLSAITKSVITSFVTSEDASFWKHDGIDGHSFEAAVRRNLIEGRVVIGASTITMQTVKNLFLSHDRTFARKYQEMVLAWHLDKLLDKERILEIYLNIIEFGPGIFGITHAAQHYFGKHPFDLTWRESVFLANLLPSPVKRHRHFCAGEVSEEYRELMDGLMRRMLNLNRIGFGVYARGLRSSLIFNDEVRATTPYCPEDVLDVGMGAG